jgi:hypothetical protein
LSLELCFRGHGLFVERQDSTLILEDDGAVRGVIDLEPSVVREQLLVVVPPHGYLGPASLEVVCFRSAGAGGAFACAFRLSALYSTRRLPHG